jgi:hypothetical protein
MLYLDAGDNGPRINAIIINPKISARIWTKPSFLNT